MKSKIIISLILIIALSLSAITVYAEGAAEEVDYYTFEDGMGKEEIPYGETDTVGTVYGHKNFKMMNEAQAAAAGVPEGYSGWVLAVDPADSSGMSFGIDLTDIKVSDIVRIRIRVWCPTGTKQDSKEGGIRFTGKDKNSWTLLASPDPLCQWMDITVEKSSYASFDYDGDGYCNPFNFCLRRAGGTAYIDHIIVELKEKDVVPPQITYDGETNIVTTAGKIFEIDATAFDERDNKNIDPEYVFSEGAVDENGLLLEGEHTCTVRFTDSSGNYSELKLSLKVEAKDVTAPTLSWAPARIYANEGMMPVINITATDDRDGEVDVVIEWSDGALERGKLVIGEHTLTVTSSDVTGNTVEVVIPVTVTANIPDVN